MARQWDAWLRSIPHRGSSLRSMIISVLADKSHALTFVQRKAMEQLVATCSELLV